MIGITVHNLLLEFFFPKTHYWFKMILNDGVDWFIFINHLEIC